MIRNWVCLALLLHVTASSRVLAGGPVEEISSRFQVLDGKEFRLDAAGQVREPAELNGFTVQTVQLITGDLMLVELSKQGPTHVVLYVNRPRQSASKGRILATVAFRVSEGYEVRTGSCWIKGVGEDYTIVAIVKEDERSGDQTAVAAWRFDMGAKRATSLRAGPVMCDTSP